MNIDSILIRLTSIPTKNLLSEQVKRERYQNCSGTWMREGSQRGENGEMPWRHLPEGFLIEVEQGWSFFFLDEFMMILKKRRPSFPFFCNKCDRVLLKLRTGPRSKRKFFFFCFYAGDWICLFNIFLWFPTRFSLKNHNSTRISGNFLQKTPTWKKNLSGGTLKKKWFLALSIVGTFTCLLAIHPQRWVWWWRNG